MAVKKRFIPTPPKGGRKKRERQELTKKQASFLEMVQQYASSKMSAFREAYAGISMKEAIRAHCFQCYGLEDLQDIKDCKSEACPLWRFRPS